MKKQTIPCRHCGMGIAIDSRHCIYCGEYIGRYLCKNCNRMNYHNNKYCEYCGKLRWKTKKVR